MFNVNKINSDGPITIAVFDTKARACEYAAYEWHKCKLLNATCWHHHASPGKHWWGSYEVVEAPEGCTPDAPNLEDGTKGDGIPSAGFADWNDCSATVYGPECSNEAYIPELKVTYKKISETEYMEVWE